VEGVCIVLWNFLVDPGGGSPQRGRKKLFVISASVCGRSKKVGDGFTSEKRSPLQRQSKKTRGVGGEGKVAAVIWTKRSPSRGQGS